MQDCSSGFACTVHLHQCPIPAQFGVIPTMCVPDQLVFACLVKAPVCLSRLVRSTDSATYTCADLDCPRALEEVEEHHEEQMMLNSTCLAVVSVVRVMCLLGFGKSCLSLSDIVKSSRPVQTCPMLNVLC